MTRAPTHAGRLRPSEQFVFALVFVLMAGFVVAITMSAARPPQQSLLAGPASAASAPAAVAGLARLQSGTGQPARTSSATDLGHAPTISAELDARLASAMRTIVAGHRGQVAVGVIDVTTGQEARYQPDRSFRAASIIATDILMTFLLRHHQDGTPVTSGQSQLATDMMAAGSPRAAVVLWRATGGGAGVAAANQALGLRRTLTRAGDNWGQTETTVADQLQLLTDLTSVSSPLPAPDREYVRGLMGGLATAERWGVLTAATDGTRCAAMAGWTSDGRRIDVDSVGVVTRHGQTLLIAVLSSQSRSPAAATALASAAALAAAQVVVVGGA